jgi:hypothetical protein
MSKKPKVFRYFIAVLCFFLLTPYSVLAASEYSGPKNLEPKLSSDGKTMFNAVPAVVYQADPNPPPKQARIPARFDIATLPEAAATSTFSITYTPNGGTDPWDASCVTFPEEAKAAFNAAAAIWANLLSSSVPITISACWSNLGSSSILGYSGGGSMYRNFTNAPLANTWYSSSLANALAGSDLGPSDYDMYITYNSNFTWYYGTDGATPSGQYDLMSVVLHEIAHGLNFSGTMSYSGGSGSWGSSTGYPNIYDTFMRDGTANPGNLLINTSVYPNPSTALGSALTSQNIWFHGSNAMAANGGQRVKMYAPSTWSGGSSYSHLDYSTFSGTANRLMVYAISSGVSTHDPGPVTMGLFQDLGWTSASNPSVATTVPANGATGVALNSTIRATFNKAMNAATITTSTFYLNNGVTGTVSYDAGTYTATFTPSANLALNTTYTATITTSVTDAGGHPMLANKTWSFTTTDGSVNIINGGFENSLSGWGTAIVTPDNSYVGTNGDWFVVNSGDYPTTSPHSGSMMARFNSFDAGPGAQTRLYQTAGVSIPSSATAATLSFWMNHDTDPDYILNTDNVQAQVSTNGSTWTDVGSPVYRYDGTTGWAQVSIDLISFKGQSVQIGFLGTSDYGNDIYLDDAALSVTATVEHTLTLNFPGAGDGKVTITPGPIVVNDYYTGQFSDGAILTLTAAAYDYSDFSSFTGNCTTNPCSLTMNANKSVNANFALDTIHKARIGASNYFSTLPLAYASPLGTTILAWGTYFAEPLTCNLVKNVTIDGGYNDAYNAKTGYTTLLGPLTISQGSLTVEELTIK